MRRTCRARNCERVLHGGARRMYCSPACKQRAWNDRNAERHRASVAAWREKHPGYGRSHIASLRASGYREVERKREDARLAARVARRQLEHPNCVICGKRLDDKQRQRGVTCGKRCAQYRWRWFVREE